MSCIKSLHCVLILCVKFIHVLTICSSAWTTHTRTLPQVAASVSVVPASHSRLSPAHFSCRQSPHTLPPHSSHRLPLTFCPALPSPHPVFAFFEVGTRGGLATTTVRCTGATKGDQCLQNYFLGSTLYTCIYTNSSVECGSAIYKGVNMQVAASLHRHMWELLCVYFQFPECP